MTKTYIMFNCLDKYLIKNNNENVYEINKKTLNVDGMKLYEVFFSNFSKGDSISLYKDESFNNSNDKLADAVFDNFKDILEKIVNEINSSVV